LAVSYFYCWMYSNNYMIYFITFLSCEAWCWLSRTAETCGYLDLIWYSVVYWRIVFIIAYCTDTGGGDDKYSECPHTFRMPTYIPNVHIHSECPHTFRMSTNIPNVHIHSEFPHITTLATNYWLDENQKGSFLKFVLIFPVS